MNLNITKLKAALIEAGHIVSEGEQWLLSDLTELEHFAFRVYGIAKEKLHYGLSYVSLLPSDFPGHPDAEDAPAKVEEAEAEPQPEAPTAPVVEEPQVEIPAEAQPEQAVETPAEEPAPAAEVAQEVQEQPADEQQHAE
jgi:hypothetical protein